MVPMMNSSPRWPSNYPRAILALGSALAAATAVAACEPAYIDVATPQDAQFDLICVGSCGPRGATGGTLINVSFGGGARGFGLCCDQHAAFVQHLVVIRDVFCRGGEVRPRDFGGLTVGTVVSEATGKLGATLDHGEGYAAFNCGEWLDDLIVGMQRSQCCAAPRPPVAPPAPPPTPAPVPAPVPTSSNSTTPAPAPAPPSDPAPSRGF